MVTYQCKDCPDRHLKCHATCEKYLAIKEENDRVRELKHHAQNNPLHTYKVEQIRKARKRKTR